MKTSYFAILALLLLNGSHLFSQSNKPNCAVLNIKQVGVFNYSNEVLGNITRREFSKLDIYEILYSEDVKDLTKKDSLGRSNSFDCFSKQCLTNTGKLIGADKMLSGQVEQMKDAIVISFRIIDVKTNKVEYSNTKEFLNINDQIKNMIIISLKEMMGRELDEELENLLIKKFSRENYINNSGVNQLNLSGTRMGMVYLFGSNKDIVTKSEAEGGFEANPIFFNFGYQFERQYLNQGRIQGLFELIPSITGLEQGLAMPSITLLHGIRDNKTGFEFAFGPSFGMAPYANGYYDENENWHLESDWDVQQVNSLDSTIIEAAPNPHTIVNRLDSRGKYKLTTGFLIGMGFSIKSGEINIPVNFYTVLQKSSMRAGISLGINARKRKR